MIGIVIFSIPKGSIGIHQLIKYGQNVNGKQITIKMLPDFTKIECCNMYIAKV